MGKLTALAARALSKPGRHGDGDGLYLHVAPAGSKSWVQRIVVDGRRRDLGLGSYPAVSLAKARSIAQTNRSAVAEGRDPVAEKREAALRPAPSVPTFAEAAARVIELRRPTWSNAKHAAQWETTLATYAHPVIGHKTVDAVTPADAMDVLTPIWTSKPETASRVRQRMETVMDWAVTHGYRLDNPAGRSLLKVLPPVKRLKEHRQALPYVQVPGAVALVRECTADIPTKLAFEFLVLTPVLIGAQGIGKSTFLRRLVPEDAHTWFSDGLTLTSTDREVAETLAGRVIVEVSEMVGLRRAEIERLKTMLSRTNDGYHRSAYARHAETRLRRCVIVGTTNSRECLPNDETGNRRFVAVEIEDGDPGRVRSYLDANLEQLWAEGLARCRAGEHPRLPDAYKRIQAKHNEGFRAADDVLEAKVAEWMLDAPEEFTLGYCGVDIGMVESEASLTLSEQLRLGKALRSLGYEKRNAKRQGRQVRLWCKVERLPVAPVASIS